MSGGAWESVMGVMIDSTDTLIARPCSGRDVTSNSGFKGKYCNVGETDSLGVGGVDFPTDTRYFDTYAYGTTDEGYNRRIFGDATGEMGPFQIKTYGIQQRQIGSWHDDEAWFVYPYNPWFNRGHDFNNGKSTGVFAFGHDSGAVYPAGSFRVVLSF